MPILYVLGYQEASNVGRRREYMDTWTHFEFRFVGNWQHRRRLHTPKIRGWEHVACKIQRDSCLWGCYAPGFGV